MITKEYSRDLWGVYLYSSKEYLFGGETLGEVINAIQKINGYIEEISCNYCIYIKRRHKR